MLFPSLPQVDEQKGVYIGLPPFHHDFDGYLYEDFGFRFLERWIPTDEFLKKYTRHDIMEFIHHLTIMRDACDRTIGKLEIVLTKRTIFDDLADLLGAVEWENDLE